MVAETEFIHRITVEEYEQMSKRGILDPLRRYELLEGMIVDVSPQSDPHAYAVSQLHEIFVLEAASLYTVRSQMPVALSASSMPEPDVVLATRGLANRPQAGDLYLIIEVSGASYPLDAGTKLRRYAASGIPEYWIVNLNERRIEVYRKPEKWAYTETSLISGDDPVAPLAFPDVTVRVPDLIAG